MQGVASTSNKIYLLAHLTPTSSLWTQLWVPIGLARQSMSLASVPRHWTSSNQILPAPAPSRARGIAVAPSSKVVTTQKGVLKCQ